MTPPNVNVQVIQKIQLLMGMANRKSSDPALAAATEAEAAVALARAQKLMAQHNLDMAVVNATFVEGGTVARPEEKREKTRVSRSAQYKWQRELWAVVAQVNFCWHNVINVYEGKRGTKSTTSKVPVKRHMLLGRESNVVVAKMMGEYIEDTMERLVTSEGGFLNSERLSRSALSWKAGCAERIAERLQEKFEAMQQEANSASANGTTAIALRDVVRMEYEANYDARYGQGAYNRKQIQDAEWEAGQAERDAKAEADQIEAERKWAEYLATESPEQKKARERREQKERIANEKRWARQNRTWRNERWREASKVDDEALERGRRAGNKVGLDGQVTETARTSTERRIR